MTAELVYWFVWGMKLRRLKNRVSPLLLITVGLTFALLTVLYLQFSRPVPEVLIARNDLARGATLDLTDFEIVGIDLGLAQDAYIPSNEIPTGGTLSKSITAGEVLAKSQITEFSPEGFTVIRIRPDLPIAESLQIGDQVSVWVVEGEQFEDLKPAEQISLGTLMTIQQSEGLFADEQPYVEINIPELTLPEVLKSMAANDNVYLVEPSV